MYSYLYIFILLVSFDFFVKAHRAKLCVNICPPCLPEVVKNCPKLLNCRHVVRQPGCGRCCDVCALNEGDRCGIGLAPCGPGLECRSATGRGVLNAVLFNQGTCQLIQNETAPRSVRSVVRNSSRRRIPRHPHKGLLADLKYNGPCSLHLEDVMTSCGTLPLIAWIPDCVRGFYRPKQCVTAGRSGSPGKCWCVNKFGKPVGRRSDTSENLSCPPE